jgi:hypothetical protein
MLSLHKTIQTAAPASLGAGYQAIRVPRRLIGAWRSPRWITYAAKEAQGWTPFGRFSRSEDLEHAMKISSDCAISLRRSTLRPRCSSASMAAAFALLLPAVLLGAQH